MAGGVGLVWDLLAKDNASPAFLKVAASADKAASSTAKATLGMQASVARMGQIGATLTKRVTLPLAAIGAVSIDQAAKFQKSMTLIQTAGGETAAKTAKISKGIQSVAMATGTSLDQLGEGIYTIAKAGAQKWSAVEQLQVLKAAAQGAKAENVPLAISVQALTSVMQGYGMKARDAVAAENMIIRGSGLAKTTMQDFASSLANVVPLASSLHISFAQVAGAIATMTQHGETAQRSTENLNNLIRNLAGGNNVAAKTMQQLGINTVDLQKTLMSQGPGGGLLGALNVVEKAVEGKNHGGFIAISAFKRAQNATRDLTVELGHMPDSLKKISTQFETGQLSYKNYYKDVKDLGGSAFEMGKQFIASMANAKGFSDALRSGNPQVATAAQMLQKMLGGATGLNVALMLGGTSANAFKSSTQQVAKAAKEAGGDVLGWSKTQDTFAVKLDKAKASLQVMAVEIGSALLPAVSKLADLGVKAARWFDGLSHTQKEVLGWSVGVIAALGPVFSIGSRLAKVGQGIGSFVGGGSRKFASLAGASDTMAARVSKSMTGLTSAVGGVGVGLAFGTLTQHASTATKLIGDFGAAATGAALGFGMGGPVGAAIGGLAGGLTSLAKQFLHLGSNASAAAQQAKQYLAVENGAAQNLLDTLKSVNGAYKEQTRQSVANQLAKTKVGKTGLDVFSAGTQLGINPYDIVTAVLGNPGVLNKVQTEILKHAGGPQDALAGALMHALSASQIGATKAEKAWERYNTAVNGSAVPQEKAATTLRGLRKEFANTGNALDTLSAAGLHNADALSAAGLHNADVIRGHIAAIGKDAAAQIKHGKSSDYVAAQVETQVGALRQNLLALGFNSQAVDNLIVKYTHLPRKVVTDLQKKGVLPMDIQAIIDKYHLVPKNVNTKVTADTSDAITKLQAVRTYLTGISNGANPVVNVTTVYRGGGRNTVKAQAAGTMSAFGQSTIPPNTAFTVGERGWEGGVTDSMGRASIFPASQALAMGFKAPVGYANGTGGPTSSQLGAILGALKAFLLPNNLLTGAGSAGQFGNLLSAVRAAGASKQFIAEIRSEDKALTDAVRKRMADAARLAKAQAALATAKQNLNQEISTVSSAVRGGFDITQAGANPVTGAITGGSIRAQQTQELNLIRKWVADIHKLERGPWGKSAGGRYMIRQLAEAGPSSYAQVAALAGMGMSALKGMASTESQILSISNSFGQAEGNRIFGGQVASAQRNVNRDKAQERRDTKLVEHLAARLGETIIHSFNQLNVKLEIDKQGIARLVDSGKKSNNQHRGASK